jgi:hypothetical protein
MSQPVNDDRKTRGRENLAARARRVSALRRGVVAATLATFVLAWGAVVLDGSMGAETTAVAEVTGSGATAVSSTATPSATTSSSDSSSSSSQSDNSGATLSTSQS